ncbi:MAG: repeat-containing protein, partial [Verrucomicrobiaceae bacterium]|nr:repeat-containing protein [Verrucomicrobiaceae bacterium]
LNNLGSVTFAGTLADGTVMTATSALVDLNKTPVFVPLATPGAATTVKGGSFGGLFNFVPTPMDTDVTSADCLWFRPAVLAVRTPATTAAATNLYTDGWPGGIKVNASGGLYAAATNVQTGLNLGTPGATGNGVLVFSNGKLNPAVTLTAFKIVANTVTKIPAANSSFTLVLAPSTGGFSGTFTPTWASPSTTKPAFKGILIQKNNIRGGYGFFLSNALSDLDPESGEVSLTARPST